MSKKLLYATSLALTAALVLAGCSRSPETPTESGGEIAGKMDELTFRLNWTPYASDHAFYYYGVDEGIYEQYGIDLSVEPGNGSGTIVKLVSEGSEPVALVDAATMLNGVSKGMDVKMVAAITQTSPMAFVSLKENPISSAADLKGSRIAITQGDSLSQVLPAVLAKAGVDVADVTTISSPTGAAKETAVLQGEADALLGYFTEQPLRMESVTGVEMGWTPFSDFGINTINMGIVVNGDWEAENADLLQRFISATQDAIEAAAENPKAAAEAFVKFNPDFALDLAIAEVEATIPLLHTKNSEGKPVGWMSTSDWEETVDVMVEYGGATPLDVETLFTNDYVGK